MGGVGMLAVGVLGALLLGNIQDLDDQQRLARENEALYQRVQGKEKLSVFGTYQPVDPAKVKTLSTEDAKTVQSIQDAPRCRPCGRSRSSHASCASAT